jgi:MEDS: MEthanogen/methylotroph, DcmR Sensory domain
MGASIATASKTNTGAGTEVQSEYGASVCVYRDAAQLSAVVSEFIAAGLRRGEAIVVLASEAHWSGIIARLVRLGTDLVGAIESGQLRMMNVEPALQTFLRDGVPAWRPFEEAANGTLRMLLRRYPGVRVYSEMVDVLAQQDRDAATCLDRYWIRLAGAWPQQLSLLRAQRDVAGGPRAH